MTKNEIKDFDLLSKQILLLNTLVIEDINEIDGVKKYNNNASLSNKINNVNPNHSKGSINHPNNYIFNTNITVDDSGELYIHLKDVNTFVNNDNIFITLESPSEKHTKKVNGIDFIKSNNKWYSGEKEIYANLGYIEKGNWNIKFELKKSGYFNLNNIEYKLLKLDFDNELKSLRETHLENIKISGDKITGRVSSNENKLLFISIPFSQGFTIKNNGKSLKIYEANNGMMDVKIRKGINNIEIDYKRPIQNISYIISLIGIIILITVYIRSIKLNKKYKI